MSQGTSVGANQTIWYNGNSAGQIYYTYNPAQGTRYLVENPVWRERDFVDFQGPFWVLAVTMK